MKLSLVTNPEVKQSIAELMSYKIPATASWQLTKLAFKFDEHFTMYQKCRFDLIKKYAATNEDGSIKLDEAQQMSVSEANMESFRKDVEELLNIDIEMPTLSVKSLNEVSVKASTLVPLHSLLTD